MNEKKNRSERETKGNKLLIDGNIKRYLDHVNRLDDASREHTGGSAIDEGLHGGPDTNRGDFLLLRHLFFVFEGILRTRNEKKRFLREREKEIGGERYTLGWWRGSEEVKLKAFYRS